jgi:hypothetical protein
LLPVRCCCNSRCPRSGRELSAAIELRRWFPGIIDNVMARECARSIAGWTPLPSQPHPVTPLPAQPHPVTRLRPRKDRWPGFLHDDWLHRPTGGGLRRQPLGKFRGGLKAFVLEIPAIDERTCLPLPTNGGEHLTERL